MHFMKRCPECKTVWEQCRCPDPGKVETSEVCPDCLEKAKRKPPTWGGSPTA